MIPFSSSVEMEKIARDARQFFERVLCDEEPIFVSDEATILDVSMAETAELLERCSKSYGKRVSAEDLKRPFGS
jgi:hypothetical protein